VRFAQPATAIGLLAVVVPVRDEAEQVGDCLAAVRRAVGSVRRNGHSDRPVPRVRVVVVLDACTDRSAAVVGRQPFVEVVHSRAGRVGAARAAGVEHVLVSDSIAPDRIWLATTDADSRVPAGWLSHQLAVAACGAGLFRGLVRPDPRDCGASAYQAWVASYRPSAGHPHVHGANLGVRGDVYLACGGFDPFATCDEDVALARRAGELAVPVVASATAVVTTSGRLRGRVPDGGFAGYLAALAG
jgi:hypothetical protein